MPELVEFPRAAANPDVVKIAKYLLSRAESGEIQALAVAFVREDGSSGTTSSGTEKSRGLVSQQALMGALMILLHRILESCPIEEDDDGDDEGGAA